MVAYRMHKEFKFAKNIYIYIKLEVIGNNYLLKNGEQTDRANRFSKIIHKLFIFFFNFILFVSLIIVAHTEITKALHLVVQEKIHALLNIC